MRLNPQNKNHRIVILILIAVPMFIIGSVIVSLADKSVEERTAAEQEEAQQEESKLQPKDRGDLYLEDKTMTEEEKESAKEVSIEDNKLTKETMQESKEVAEKFAMAYQTYNSENPDATYEAVKPYIGYTMERDWKESPPRWPITISETIAKEYETYLIEGGSNYEIAWNVVVQVENKTYTGETSTSEEWLWIYLTKEDEGWKVQRMDITNG